MATERTFTAWLAEHRSGLADHDLTTALADALLAAVRERKTASLTLTIKVEPSGEGVLVTDVITTKVPQPPPESKHYFVDELGQLTRRHPLQPSLPSMEDHDA